MSGLRSFDEVRFPELIDFGFTGGPSFFTTIVRMAGGNEQRNVNWEEARARYTSAHRLKTQTELDDLIAFFRARRGKAIGFRFRDWMDFCTDMPGILDAGVINPFDGVLDALPAAGVLAPQILTRVDGGGAQIGDGVEVDYQLAKLYPGEPRLGTFDGSGGITLTFADANPDTITRSSGSWITDGFAAGQYLSIFGSASNDGCGLLIDSVTATVITLDSGEALTAEGPATGISVHSGATGAVDFVRPIRKPVASATRIYLDAVEQSTPANYSLDDTTGIVTFTVAPAAGAVPTWDGLFDVPCRFDTDEFNASLRHFNTHDWDSIVLVELRT